MHLTIDHTWIGIGALIGAAASAVVYAADFLMLGKPRLSRTFSSIGVITQINDTRLYWGCVLGVLFIPVMIFGVVAVAAQFVAHSIAAALFVLVTWTLFLALGSAVHNGFGYLGQVAKAKSHFGDSAIPPCFSAAEREQTRYFKAVVTVSFSLFALGSFVFSAMVLAGFSRYPWWVGFWCPFLILVIARESYRFLPPVAAPWISPTCVQIALLPLFVATFFWAA